MTTASKVTLSRVLLIPVFMACMLLDFPYSRIVALVIFILASATDGIDGYIARNYNQISDFGKFMDPLADKLLVTSAMLIFIQWGQMPAWAVMIILAREFAVSGLRMMAASSGTVIAAGFSGKVKTVVTIVALCLMLTSFHDRQLIGGLTVDGVCVLAMVVTTVYSGVEYFGKNYKVLFAS